MKRKLTVLITAVILALACISALAEDTSGQYTWDLTTLTASDYNANTYTYINSVLSVKADPQYVTSDGIKVSKNNNVRIKIEPAVDSELTVTCSGSVILTEYEKRKGGEENITPGTVINLTAGTVYYLHGSASSAAAITAIKYVTKDGKPIATLPPQETTPPASTTEPSETTEPEPTAIPKPTAAPDMEFDETWDLRGLTGDYNKNEYLSTIYDEVSIKVASGNVTSDGVKVNKNEKIKIVPEANGQLVISFADTAEIVVTDSEKRTGEETPLVQNEIIDVLGGATYYIQGNSSNYTTVSEIRFKEVEFELFKVTGVGFSEDYSNILEFDVEMGDNYDESLTACLCVYDSEGRLKAVGTRNIQEKALVVGSNTVKCNIDITGYDKDNDTLKIFLWTGIK